LHGCDGILYDVRFHQPSGEFIPLHDSYPCRADKISHLNQLSFSVLVKFNICTLNQALESINAE